MVVKRWPWRHGPRRCRRSGPTVVQREHLTTLEDSVQKSGRRPRPRDHRRSVLIMPEALHGQRSNRH
jgi:hypothetical protein